MQARTLCRRGREERESVGGVVLPVAGGAQVAVEVWAGVVGTKGRVMCGSNWGEAMVETIP